MVLHVEAEMRREDYVKRNVPRNGLYHPGKEPGGGGGRRVHSEQASGLVWFRQLTARAYILFTTRTLSIWRNK